MRVRFFAYLVLLLHVCAKCTLGLHSDEESIGNDVCTKEGVLEVSPELSTYTKCIYDAENGVQLIHQNYRCGKNSLFDTDAGACTQLVGGGDLLFPLIGSHCPKHGGSDTILTYRDEPVKHKFYGVCFGKIIVLLECPKNQFFSDQLRKCIDDVHGKYATINVSTTNIPLQDCQHVKSQGLDDNGACVACLNITKNELQLEISQICNDADTPNSPDAYRTVIGDIHCPQAPLRTCDAPGVFLIETSENYLSECENCYYLCSESRNRTLKLSVVCSQESQDALQKKSDGDKETRLGQFDCQSAPFIQCEQDGIFAVKITPKIRNECGICTYECSTPEDGDYFELSVKCNKYAAYETEDSSNQEGTTNNTPNDLLITPQELPSSGLPPQVQNSPYTFQPITPSESDNHNTAYYSRPGSYLNSNNNTPKKPLAYHPDHAKPAASTDEFGLPKQQPSEVLTKSYSANPTFLPYKPNDLENTYQPFDINSVLTNPSSRPIQHPFINPNSGTYPSKKYLDPAPTLDHNPDNYSPSKDTDPINSNERNLYGRPPYSQTNDDFQKQPEYPLYRQPSPTLTNSDADPPKTTIPLRSNGLSSMRPEENLSPFDIKYSSQQSPETSNPLTTNPNDNYPFSPFRDHTNNIISPTNPASQGFLQRPTDDNKVNTPTPTTHIYQPHSSPRNNFDENSPNNPDGDFLPYPNLAQKHERQQYNPPTFFIPQSQSTIQPNYPNNLGASSPNHGPSPTHSTRPNQPIHLEKPSPHGNDQLYPIVIYPSKNEPYLENNPTYARDPSYSSDNKNFPPAPHDSYNNLPNPYLPHNKLSGPFERPKPKYHNLPYLVVPATYSQLPDEHQSPDQSATNPFSDYPFPLSPHNKLSDEFEKPKPQKELPRYLIEPTKHLQPPAKYELPHDSLANAYDVHPYLPSPHNEPANRFRKPTPKPHHIPKHNEIDSPSTPHQIPEYLIQPETYPQPPEKHHLADGSPTSSNNVYPHHLPTHNKESDRFTKPQDQIPRYFVKPIKYSKPQRLYQPPNSSPPNPYDDQPYPLSPNNNLPDKPVMDPNPHLEDDKHIPRPPNYSLPPAEHQPPNWSPSNPYDGYPYAIRSPDNTLPDKFERPIHQPKHTNFVPRIAEYPKSPVIDQPQDSNPQYDHPDSSVPQNRPYDENEMSGPRFLPTHRQPVNKHRRTPRDEIIDKTPTYSQIPMDNTDLVAYNKHPNYLTPSGVTPDIFNQLTDRYEETPPTDSIHISPYPKDNFPQNKPNAHYYTARQPIIIPTHNPNRLQPYQNSNPDEPNNLDTSLTQPPKAQTPARDLHKPTFYHPDSPMYDFHKPNENNNPKKTYSNTFPIHGSPAPEQTPNHHQLQEQPLPSYSSSNNPANEFPPETKPQVKFIPPYDNHPDLYGKPLDSKKRPTFLTPNNQEHRPQIDNAHPLSTSIYPSDSLPSNPDTRKSSSHEQYPKHNKGPEDNQKRFEIPENIDSPNTFDNPPNVIQRPSNDEHLLQPYNYNTNSYKPHSNLPQYPKSEIPFPGSNSPYDKDNKNVKFQPNFEIPKQTNNPTHPLLLENYPPSSSLPENPQTSSNTPHLYLNKLETSPNQKSPNYRTQHPNQPYKVAPETTHSPELQPKDSGLNINFDKTPTFLHGSPSNKPSNSLYSPHSHDFTDLNQYRPVHKKHFPENKSDRPHNENQPNYSTTFNDIPKHKFPYTHSRKPEPLAPHNVERNPFNNPQHDIDYTPHLYDIPNQNHNSQNRHNGNYDDSSAESPVLHNYIPTNLKPLNPQPYYLDNSVPATDASTQLIPTLHDRFSPQDSSNIRKILQSSRYPIDENPGSALLDLYDNNPNLFTPYNKAQPDASNPTVTNVKNHPLSPHHSYIPHDLRNAPHPDSKTYDSYSYPMTQYPKQRQLFPTTAPERSQVLFPSDQTQPTNIESSKHKNILPLQHQPNDVLYPALHTGNYQPIKPLSRTGTSNIPKDIHPLLTQVKENPSFKPTSLSPNDLVERPTEIPHKADSPTSHHSVSSYFPNFEHANPTYLDINQQDTLHNRRQPVYPNIPEPVEEDSRPLPIDRRPTNLYPRSYGLAPNSPQIGDNDDDLTRTRPKFDHNNVQNTDDAKQTNYKKQESKYVNVENVKNEQSQILQNREFDLETTDNYLTKYSEPLPKRDKAADSKNVNSMDKVTENQPKLIDSYDQVYQNVDYDQQNYDAHNNRAQNFIRTISPNEDYRSPQFKDINQSSGSTNDNDKTVEKNPNYKYPLKEIPYYPKTDSIPEYVGPQTLLEPYDRKPDDLTSSTDDFPKRNRPSQYLKPYDRAPYLPHIQNDNDDFNPLGSEPIYEHPLVDSLYYPIKPTDEFPEPNKLTPHSQPHMTVPQFSNIPDTIDRVPFIPYAPNSKTDQLDFDHHPIVHASDLPRYPKEVDKNLNYPEYMHSKFPASKSLPYERPSEIIAFDKSNETDSILQNYWSTLDELRHLEQGSQNIEIDTGYSKISGPTHNDEIASAYHYNLDYDTLIGRSHIDIENRAHKEPVYKSLSDFRAVEGSTAWQHTETDVEKLSKNRQQLQLLRARENSHAFKSVETDDQKLHKVAHKNARHPIHSIYSPKTLTATPQLRPFEVELDRLASYPSGLPHHNNMSTTPQLYYPQDNILRIYPKIWKAPPSTITHKGYSARHRPNINRFHTDKIFNVQPDHVKGSLHHLDVHGISSLVNEPLITDVNGNIPIPQERRPNPLLEHRSKIFRPSLYKITNDFNDGIIFPEVPSLEPSKPLPSKSRYPYKGSLQEAVEGVQLLHSEPSSYGDNNSPLYTNVEPIKILPNFENTLNGGIRYNQPAYRDSIVSLGNTGTDFQLPRHNYPRRYQGEDLDQRDKNYVSRAPPQLHNTIKGIEPAESSSNHVLSDNNLQPLLHKTIHRFAQQLTNNQQNIPSYGDFQKATDAEEYNNNVICDQKPIPDQPCPFEGFFRYQSSCTQFYKCTYNAKCRQLQASTVHSCISCLQFSQIQQQCVLPEYVPECTYLNISEHRDFNKHIQAKQSFCTAEGRYAVPDDNTKYYNCIQNHHINSVDLTVQSCPNGQTWDDTMHMCNYYSNKHADQPCDDRKNGFVGDRNDCNIFYHCSDGNANTLLCPANHIFNGEYCESESISKLLDWNDFLTTIKI